MDFEDLFDGVGGGESFDDGDEFHPRSVAFDDFASDHFIDLVVVAFNQNVGTDFADQVFRRS